MPSKSTKPNRPATDRSQAPGELAADLLWRAADEAEWRRVPMKFLGNDHWTAQVLDPDNTTVVLELDPYDGHVITRRN